MAKRTHTKRAIGGSSKKKHTTVKSKKVHRKLKPDEAWCVHRECKGPVVMKNPVEFTKQTKNRLVKMKKGTCPKGHNVYRLVGGN
jgi:hypothetical protein